MKRIIILLSLTLLAIISCEKQKTYGNIQAGDTIPAFYAELSDGTILTERYFDNTTGLIVLFSTSCPQCHAVLDDIQDLWARFGGYVPLLAAARDDKDLDVYNFFKDRGYAFPYVADENRGIFNLFAEDTVPRVYLVENGVVTKAWSDNPTVTYDDLFEVFFNISVVPGDPQ